MKPMILIGQVNISPGDNSNVGAFLLPRRGWFRDYESPSKLLTDFYKYITVGSPAEGTCRAGGGLGTRCFGFLIYSDISAALRGLLFISCRSGLARQFVLCQARRPRLCSHRGWEEKCRQHRRGSCLLESCRGLCNPIRCHTAQFSLHLLLLDVSSPTLVSRSQTQSGIYPEFRVGCETIPAQV